MCVEGGSKCKIAAGSAAPVVGQIVVILWFHRMFSLKSAAKIGVKNRTALSRNTQFAKKTGFFLLAAYSLPNLFFAYLCREVKKSRILNLES